MIATPRPDLAQFDLEALGSAERSPGLHLSALIKRLMQRVEPERFGGAGGPDATRMALGVAFEEALEHTLARRWPGLISRPGEFAKDGIAISPDGLELNGEPRIHEYKCTWMRLERAPDGTPDADHPKYWHWLLQIKGYCYVVGATKARLWVFFVNGDYRPPKPERVVWDLEFAPQELEETWQLLLREKEAGE